MDKPTILIVDDEMIFRDAVEALLEDHYSVIGIESGEALLAELNGSNAARPDLVLLDIEMRQLDGYETCRAMREAGHDQPVIFVSSHDTVEERLRAFEAGGNDFISKPYDAEELQHKIQLAIAQKLQSDGLHEVTQQILHEVGETGVLLAFLREAIRITDYAALASLLLKAVGDFGLHCFVQLRHDGGAVTLTPGGEPTPMELSILARATSLDHKFRMGRRLVVNYPIISLLVQNMPSDAERSRRLTDYLDVLVESAEAVAETIGVRRESATRAETLMVATAGSFRAVESLRESYLQQQAETRKLLQELIDEVENTYVHLGLTENQESIISNTMRYSAEKILHLFEQNVEFERQFTAVLDALKPQNNDDADVWL